MLACQLQCAVREPLGRQEVFACVCEVSRAVRRWHGHVSDLARDLKQQGLVGNLTLFVLPSSGVADRIRKMTQ